MPSGLKPFFFNYYSSTYYYYFGSFGFFFHNQFTIFISTQRLSTNNKLIYYIRLNELITNNTPIQI